jgi:hypothetical protein
MQRESEEDGVSWLNSDMARFIPVIEVQETVSCMCLTPTNDLCIGTSKGAILVCVSPAAPRRAPHLRLHAIAQPDGC